MVRFGLALPLRGKTELLVPPLLSIAAGDSAPAPDAATTDLYFTLHFRQRVRHELQPLWHDADLERGFLPLGAFHQLCAAALSWSYHTAIGFEPSIGALRTRETLAK